MALADRGASVRFLIHDRDARFSGPFDEVFRAEGTSIIRTPIRAPNANAVAERCVATVRSECLDWTLVFGRRHLDRVLHTYLRHYNEHRPHRALDLQPPDPGPRPDAVPSGGPSEGAAARHPRRVDPRV